MRFVTGFAATVIFLLAVSGCGGDSHSPSDAMGDGAAKTVIAEYLEDAEYDKTVRAAFSPMEEYVCSVFGLYASKGVCVRYLSDPHLQRSPSVSDTVDYMLDIPKSDEAQIREEMQKLEMLDFMPVFSDPLDLHISIMENADFTIRVRWAQALECNITLEENSTESVQVSYESAYQWRLYIGSKSSGGYALMCVAYNEYGSNMVDGLLLVSETGPVSSSASSQSSSAASSLSDGVEDDGGPEEIESSVSSSVSSSSASGFAGSSSNSSTSSSGGNDTGPSMATSFS